MVDAYNLTVNERDRKYKRHFTMLEIFIIAGAIALTVLMTSLLLTLSKRYVR